jgi:hypothetical protein
VEIDSPKHVFPFEGPGDQGLYVVLKPVAGLAAAGRLGI